jgi:hypothetical protein
MIQGDVFWVPEPMRTDSWQTLYISRAGSTVGDLLTEIEQAVGISRFTIDELRSGEFVLAFSNEYDKLAAKFAIG